MKRNRRNAIAALLLTGALALGTTACETDDEKARKEQQSQKATGETLGKKNLREKLKREENPNAIGYVYLLSFGKPMGYYIVKGKVSSNGSQLTPQDEIVDTCGSDDCSVVVDGPQDDGTYGNRDPGIFFFLSDGTMVTTSLDYVYTDRPIQAVNVPLLGGTK
ncbi:hypothetical protein [Shimazuella alba]|uniref:Lipoprotein n=1 Tax=Shimazuella alba TaxID=2690964 RepID=A0A6I4W6S6_9BACL|nr:hypothetical protein [Shimazuella alba]MXQ56012.1 hypothetical protein [Shimazuella alba]